MKKLFIYTICGLATLTMTGCGGSGSKATIKDLNNQLTRIETSISIVNKQDLSSVSQKNIVSNNSYNGVYSNTYQNQTNKTENYNFTNLQNKVSNDIYTQSELTNQISNRVDNLQNILKNNKTRYNRNQVKALSSLTNELSNYATLIKNSKEQVSESLDTINYNRNINHVSLDRLSAGYNSLSNTLESRKAYYYNILNTLSQVENIICGENCNYTNFQENSSTQKPLIDTAKNTNTINNNNTETTNEKTAKRNINIPDNFKEKAQTNQSVPQYPNYNPNMYNNSYYNNQYYNNGYGYNNGYYNGNYYQRGITNPTRNTDTYRPNRINIDSYKLAPNNSGNIIYRNGHYNNSNNLIPASYDNEIKEGLNIDTNGSKKLLEQNKEMQKPEIKRNKSRETALDGKDEKIDNVENATDLNTIKPTKTYTKPVKTATHIVNRTHKDSSQTTKINQPQKLN